MKSLNLPYNPQIDQLRFFAAILVFCFHFQLEVQSLGGIGLQGACWALITQGHTGVGLFFTLSGFLFMQIALTKDNIPFFPFIRNRFLRIFPLFFVIFLLATSIGRDRFVPTDIFYIFASNLGLAPTSYTGDYRGRLVHIFRIFVLCTLSGFESNRHYPRTNVFDTHVSFDDFL